MQVALCSLIAVAIIASVSLPGILGQGTRPALVPQHLKYANFGDLVHFSCESNGVPLSLCLWERLPLDQDKSRSLQSGTGNANFLLSFNPVNTRVGLYSGAQGYSYKGDGLAKGQCGLKIDSAKKSDFARWQCTLFSDSKGISTLFRGTVDIIQSREEPKPRPFVQSRPIITKQPEPSQDSISGNKGSFALITSQADPRLSRQYPENEERIRPVITAPFSDKSETESRGLNDPEETVGFQVSEVEVQSAHLVIKGGKVTTNNKRQQ